ncbi:MAG TPA: hypothetical protein VK968_15370 [Roseimicrobium sp.]|nr:hypothetical protein [Roseimicrobium sp.]
MAIELDYQRVDATLGASVGRIVRRTGMAVAIVGGIVTVVGGAANLQYVGSYPVIDVLLTALGLLAAPLIGGGLVACGAQLRGRPRAAGGMAMGLFAVIAVGCAAIITGATVEAVQSAQHGAHIDAAITAGGGVGLPLAGIAYCLWVIRKLRRVATA